MIIKTYNKTYYIIQFTQNLLKKYIMKKSKSFSDFQEIKEYDEDFKNIKYKGKRLVYSDTYGDDEIESKSCELCKKTYGILKYRNILVCVNCNKLLKTKRLKNKRLCKRKTYNLINFILNFIYYTLLCIVVYLTVNYTKECVYEKMLYIDTQKCDSLRIVCIIHGMYLIYSRLFNKSSKKIKQS